MKVKAIEIPAAGISSRDCELICLCDYKEFTVSYRKEEDNTFWLMKCEGLIAYKVISEEFSTTGYLIDMPTEGVFFEILDSPWIHDIGEHERITGGCKHYVLNFRDEIIEVIAQKLIFDQLKEKPIIMGS